MFFKIFINLYLFILYKVSYRIGSFKKTDITVPYALTPCLRVVSIMRATHLLRLHILWTFHEI